MHIAFFSDQHPGTLGGLQVSLGTQRKHLELRGHTVTVCAPDSRRVPTPEYGRPGDVLLSSQQVGAHSFSLAGERFDRVIDAAFARKPAVDIVHVQADVWGAWNGYRFARRHGLPVVHTMHTNIAVGLPAILPFPRAATRLLFAAQQRYLASGPVRTLADYTRAFAERADLLIAPSAHFAGRLSHSGAEGTIHVLPTGVDDEIVGEVCASPRTPGPRARLVWPGRLSPEKQLTTFLAALAGAQVDADVHVYGSGSDLHRGKRLAESLGIADQLTFHGAVRHREVLQAMRDADAVVLSSLGYETQGLTAFEAVSLGTPVILRDPEVSRELPHALRHTAADTSVAAFASAIADFVRGLAAAGGAERVYPRPSDAFLQSSLTERAEGLYALARSRHRRAAVAGAQARGSARRAA